jgi:hypothetical protein
MPEHRLSPGVKGKFNWNGSGQQFEMPVLPVTLPLTIRHRNSPGGCAEIVFDQP